MRKKEMKLIVTFYTTSEAMEMEQACRERGAPGRLVPVPKAISAGCGLAWCAGLECREALQAVMQEVGIRKESMQECMV